MHDRNANVKNDCKGSYTNFKKKLLVTLKTFFSNFNTQKIVKYFQHVQAMSVSVTLVIFHLAFVTLSTLRDH